jgi:hypothetical protein
MYYITQHETMKLVDVETCINSCYVSTSVASRLRSSVPFKVALMNILSSADHSARSNGG